jgi:apolipoprotein N-acyltransferase
LSGVLLFACFPLLNWHPLVWVATAPLLAAAVNEPQLGRAYLLGVLTGSIFLAGSVYWFVEVMTFYGHMTPVLALAAMVPFLVLFSSFWGVFALVLAWAARRSLAAALLLSPFLWVALELARTYQFINGFPWNLLGYAVQPSGLRQLASTTAVYGLSFLAVASSALITWAILEWQAKQFWPLVAWVVLLVAANYVLNPPPAPLGTNVALLIQPNVPMDEAAQANWAPWQNPKPLASLVAMTEESLSQLSPQPLTPPLIVWSENPAPFFFGRDPVFRAAIENMARRAHAYVVVGTNTFEGPDDTLPHNSAVALNPSGQLILQYDKIHLVPFGEYVPSWLPGTVGKITSQVGNYVAGTRYEAAATAEGAIGIFICYESIFPQLVRRLTPPGPGVLVNISDDAWYGDSSAAYQHLEIARFRAIENHRFLLRATNDGVTAVIDPYGRILETIPRHRAMALAGNFSFLGEETFYKARGDVFGWLCVVASGVIVGFAAFGAESGQ